MQIFHCIVYHISIHSLRMEGDLLSRRTKSPEPDISIHSLRMEGDLFGHLLHFSYPNISIHSLRMEGDKH